MTPQSATPGEPPCEPAAEPLFFESGASWYWALTGPAAAASVLLIQNTSGVGVQPIVPLAFLVLVSAFVALQIKAARIHTSVELTAETLRQGTETILVEEITGLYPEPKDSGWRRYGDRRADPGGGRPNPLASRALRKAGVDVADLSPQTPGTQAEAEAGADAAVVAKWQSARALGELTGVPRGRTGVGLMLTDRRTAQAWARDHRGLRTALTTLIARRDGAP